MTFKTCGHKSFEHQKLLSLRKHTAYKGLKKYCEERHLSKEELMRYVTICVDDILRNDFREWTVNGKKHSNKKPCVCYRLRFVDV